jgi:DNA-binding transcriptional ArsR family regulator
MNPRERVAMSHPARVELLNALRDGRTVDMATYAEATDMPLSRVEYHSRALRDVGAVTVEGRSVLITESGEVLRRLAQQPDRRTKDRRRGDRRRD